MLHQKSVIRFAGLALLWAETYARGYAEKLAEMGYDSKAIASDGSWIVAYSHRPFSQSEALTAYATLTEN